MSKRPARHFTFELLPLLPKETSVKKIRQEDPGIGIVDIAGPHVVIEAAVESGRKRMERVAGAGAIDPEMGASAVQDPRAGKKCEQAAGFGIALGQVEGHRRGRARAVGREIDHQRPTLDAGRERFDLQLAGIQRQGQLDVAEDRPLPHEPLGGDLQIRVGLIEQSEGQWVRRKDHGIIRPAMPRRHAEIPEIERVGGQCRR